jgi:hypothetical protein
VYKEALQISRGVERRGWEQDDLRVGHSHYTTYLEQKRKRGSTPVSPKPNILNASTGD